MIFMNEIQYFALVRSYKELIKSLYYAIPAKVLQFHIIHMIQKKY